LDADQGIAWTRWVELIDRRVRVGDDPAAAEFADSVGHFVAPAWEIDEDSAISRDGNACGHLVMKFEDQFKVAN
jgi:hypothetical protein